MRSRLALAAIALLALRLPVAGEDLRARLDREVPELMRAGDVPGLSIAVVRDGQLFWSGAFGVRDVTTGAPVQKDTIFPAASLSKPVVAYTVLRLADRGVLSLDAPLWGYLPYDRLRHDKRGQRITARMVLSHTTGLPNWGPEKLPFRADPGERFGYSGEGFVYLQKVVEKLTGQPLAGLARTEVFVPLGMTRSSFVWEPAFTEGGGAVTGVDGAGGAQTIPTGREANAAASLLTTAEDYSRFLLAVLDGTGLKKESADAMFSPQVRIPGRLFDPGSPPGMGEVGWGLGWGLERGGPSEPFRLWHWGDNGGFKAWVTASREKRAGVVYFTNTTEGLSIAEAVSALAVEVPQPALGRLGYDRHDSPERLARKELERAFSKEGTEAGLRLYREIQAKSPALLEGDLVANLAGYLQQAGKSAEVLALLKLHVETHPRSADAHAALASIFLTAGDYEQALAGFRKSASLDRKDKRKKEIRWTEEGLNALRHPVTLTPDALNRFAGTYGPRRVTLEDGSLVYSREGRPRKHKLIPMGKDTFLLDGMGDFRVRFVADKSGRVTKIVGMYANGEEDETLREP
jgi:CubicO group peptidase (beta-lactamase class C family)